MYIEDWLVPQTFVGERTLLKVHNGAHFPLCIFTSSGMSFRSVEGQKKRHAKRKEKWEAKHKSTAAVAPETGEEGNPAAVAAETGQEGNVASSSQHWRHQWSHEWWSHQPWWGAQRSASQRIWTNNEIQALLS